MRSIVAVLICLFTLPLAFADTASRPEKIGALARLEPHNGIYTLAGPPSFISVRISEMPLKEGQRVRKGDVIAIFDMANVRRLEVGIARTEVERAKVDALEKKREFDRRQILFRDKSISQESFYDQRDASERAHIALEKARLNLKRAEALLNKMIIRSPVDGMVLGIYARDGEAVSETTGIAEIGDVDHMEAVAEVYETDIKYVKKGQSAIFRSPALNMPLTGTVTRIAPSLTRVAIYSLNPVPNSESRIVKVYITLQDSVRAARFINLQGTARIDTLHTEN
ncbi:cobalt-zinc-cadmium resistance protein CzcB [bacterium BMS3Abin11]|nr:cobalt-zinc-cadmium resistance protein CzcB [bacterium BMS3Abin11]